MTEVGIYIPTGEKITIEYLQDENYVYSIGCKRTYFKTNSGLNAYAKLIHDVGMENIKHYSRNEASYTPGSYWKEMYLPKVRAYEGTEMEHAIGLSVQYSLPPKNSKGLPLKRYIYYRNYYTISDSEEEKERMKPYVECGFMKEVEKGYFKATWNGLYWLETKYNLKLYEEE